MYVHLDSFILISPPSRAGPRENGDLFADASQRRYRIPETNRNDVIWYSRGAPKAVEYQLPVFYRCVV